MRALITAAALAVMSTTSFANDASKTGVYAGALLGYSIDQLDTASDFKITSDGLFGGAMIGFQVDGGPVVYGIEADIGLKNVSASASDGEYSVKASSDYLGSVRARLGLDAGPAIIYGTAGLAYTNAELSLSGPENAKADDNVWGVVYGAGIDLNMTANTFVRLEALQYQFDDVTFNFAGGSASTDLNQSVVRAGLGFKF